MAEKFVTQSAAISSSVKFSNSVAYCIVKLNGKLKKTLLFYVLKVWLWAKLDLVLAVSGNVVCILVVLFKSKTLFYIRTNGFYYYTYKNNHCNVHIYCNEQLKKWFLLRVKMVFIESTFNIKLYYDMITRLSQIQFLIFASSLAILTTNSMFSQLFKLIEKAQCYSTD